MFEKQKENKLQKAFNFFKLPEKKPNPAVKVTKASLKVGSFIFRMTSYLLGTLFFISIFFGMMHASGRMSYNDMVKQNLVYEQQIAKRQALGLANITKTNWALVDMLKSQKIPEASTTIEMLNEKYPTGLQYTYAGPEAIHFNRNINDYNHEAVQYVISFKDKNTNIRIINSNRQIFEDFAKTAATRTDTKDIKWSKNGDNAFDSNIKSDYLSIDIK